MTEVSVPADGLLAADEPHPVVVERAEGASPLLLCCDHAGRRIPRRLGTLGLPEAELDRHIAYDIGAYAVARGLSARLDAALAAQLYSRLVIDCNRRPGVASSIPEVSESTEIPGNRALPAADRAAREATVLAPYQTAIAALLDARAAAGRPVVMVTVHSFTPVFKGVARPWHLGVIHGRDDRGARVLRPLVDGEPGLVVGVNEPYEVEMASDYTLPVHAEGRGLPYVELEIRQDLIATADGQQAWIDRLAPALGTLADRLVGGTAGRRDGLAP